MRDATTFRVALWLTGQARDLKAGEYRFADAAERRAGRGRAGPRRHLHAAGDLPRRADHRRDGRRLRRRAGSAPRAAFVDAARDASLIRDLDPLATDLEGYLFPDTYPVPRHTPAPALVGADGARIPRRVHAGPGCVAAAAQGLIGPPGGDPGGAGGEGDRAGRGAAARRRRLPQPAAPRDADAGRSHRDLRAAAGGPVERQPDPRGPDVRLALQHLSLPRTAAGADRGAGHGAPWRRWSSRRRSTTCTSSAATTAATSSPRRLREHNRNVYEWQVRYFRETSSASDRSTIDRCDRPICRSVDRSLRSADRAIVDVGRGTLRGHSGSGRPFHSQAM